MRPNSIDFIPATIVWLALIAQLSKLSGYAFGQDNDPTPSQLIALAPANYEVCFGVRGHESHSTGFSFAQFVRDISFPEPLNVEELVGSASAAKEELITVYIGKEIRAPSGLPLSQGVKSFCSYSVSANPTSTLLKTWYSAIDAKKVGHEDHEILCVTGEFESSPIYVCLFESGILMTSNDLASMRDSIGIISGEKPRLIESLPGDIAKMVKASHSLWGFRIFRKGMSGSDEFSPFNDVDARKSIRDDGATGEMFWVDDKRQNSKRTLHIQYLTTNNAGGEIARNRWSIVFDTQTFEISGGKLVVNATFEIDSSDLESMLFKVLYLYGHGFEI